MQYIKLSHGDSGSMLHRSVRLPYCLLQHEVGNRSPLFNVHRYAALLRPAYVDPPNLPQVRQLKASIEKDTVAHSEANAGIRQVPTLRRPRNRVGRARQGHATA